MLGEPAQVLGLVVLSVNLTDPRASDLAPNAQSICVYVDTAKTAQPPAGLADGDACFAILRGYTSRAMDQSSNTA